MKKFISLLLTVVMVMSIIIPVGADEGNAAVYFHGANVDVSKLGTSWFNYSYAYINDQDYVRRVSTSGAEHYGGFNFMQVFDFKVTDYGTASDHLTDFTFSTDIWNYHFGYSFTEKAFVVYDMYMSGTNPSSGYTVLGKTSYDLKLDQWYEMGIRFVDKTISLYLNGIEMLVVDLAEAYTNAGKASFIETWDWTARERPEQLKKDMYFFTAVDVDIYLDNMSFYPGDYDISTGSSASGEAYRADSDFTDMELPGGESSRNFCDFHFGDNFVRDSNGGTSKVVYNRAEAAAHEHNWVLNAELSSTAHCLIPGYDLYECSNGCGASEQRNYVAPLGHLKGYIDTTVYQCDEDESGVEKRVCTRDGCGLTYTALSQLTDTTNGALHGYTDGSSLLMNGYMGVSAKEMMAVEKGVYVEFDIMPIAQTEGKDFAAVVMWLGGGDDTYYIGYDYANAKYYVEYRGENIMESDKAFDNFEWQKWVIVHDDLNIKFYIDGELIFDIAVPSTLYTDVDDNGNESARALSDCFQFVFTSPAVEILMDNLVVADPKFDMYTRSGVVYTDVDFNGDTINSNGMILENDRDGVWQACEYIAKQGLGYQIEPYGRPAQAVTAIHQDRVLKLDSNYEAGSIYGYSQLVASDEGTSFMDMFVEKVDLEFTYDFYVYDWCTDPELLGEGSAFIGSHINSYGNGNENTTYGNGFVGYDFIRQQAVIGSVGNQAGGAYGENNVYADYTVEKNTWHNMSIQYKTDYSDDGNDENDFYILSVYMDGKLVLSEKFDYWYLQVDYFIFFPNFIKGYFDNITVKLNGVAYDNAVDFTNGYKKALTAITFDSGDNAKDWSIADGGVPTHVYEAKIFPASCTEWGMTTYNCSCGDSTYSMRNIEPTGHEYDDGVVTIEPTGSTKGEMTYTCIHCGDSYTEEIATLFTYGDVNGDGAVDNADVSDLNKFMKAPNFEINAAASDVNDDGSVDNADVSNLYKFMKAPDFVLGPVA